MYILGISAFYHDSAVLLKDGEIVAAAQEDLHAKSMMLAFHIMLLNTV